MALLKFRADWEYEFIQFLQVMKKKYPNQYKLMDFDYNISNETYIINLPVNYAKNLLTQVLKNVDDGQVMLETLEYVNSLP